MFNVKQEKNIKHIKNLIEKEGYTDLGWANEGVEFTNSNREKRLNPIRVVDCSLYAQRGTHKVFIDDDAKELLRVDMSD